MDVDWNGYPEPHTDEYNTCQCPDHTAMRYPEPAGLFPVPEWIKDSGLYNRMRFEYGLTDHAPALDQEAAAGRLPDSYAPSLASDAEPRPAAWQEGYSMKFTNSRRLELDDGQDRDLWRAHHDVAAAQFIRQFRREAYRDNMTMLAVRTDDDTLREPFRQPGYPGDCGLDLEITEDIRLLPGDSANVPCGVAVALPPDTFGWICGRSSTWTKWGLWVMPGIIDEGWRGELRTLVYRPQSYRTNEHGHRIADDSFLVVPKGTRLAQLIVLPNLVAQVRVVRPARDRLPESERGEQGFGSTG